LLKAKGSWKREYKKWLINFSLFVLLIPFKIDFSPFWINCKRREELQINEYDMNFSGNGDEIGEVREQ
jgi:hypothetical protein